MARFAPASLLPSGILAAIAWLALPAGDALAGRDVMYRNDQGYMYYSIWWQPYRSDDETALLLHFNKPRPPAWARPGNAKIDAETKEKGGESDALGDQLGALAAEGDTGGGGGGMVDSAIDSMEKQESENVAQADGRDRSAEAPAGKIYDYSPNLAEIEIPSGVSITDDGRFGKGLRFDGETGLRLHLGKKGGRQAIEGWFKPVEIPGETVCLLASQMNGARLLLRPDGHVVFERHAANEQEPLKLVSEKPIEAGEWTHIACYVFLFKHIEGPYKKEHEVRLRIDGRVSDKVVRRRVKRARPVPFDLAKVGPFFIGMNPERARVFRGVIDELRVAGRRRYNKRQRLPWRDPKAERPIPFGPPHFQKAERVFHASFESRRMRIPEDARIEWDLGEHASFADMQVPGIYGKGLLIDPAFGLPRIPIDGLSMKEGTLELWFKPVNWDNRTDYAGKAPPNRRLTLLRFMGRDTETGEIVPFMEFGMPRAVVHGITDWFQPGQWSHLIWSWSPEDVYEEDLAWGNDPPQKGDPMKVFRALRDGEQVWKAILKRKTDYIGRIEPLYLEIGIPEDVTAYQGQRPAIVVDEVIGHGYGYSKAEMKKAPDRWKGELSAE